MTITVHCVHAGNLFGPESAFAEALSISARLSCLAVPLLHAQNAAASMQANGEALHTTFA